MAWNESKNGYKMKKKSFSLLCLVGLFGAERINRSVNVSFSLFLCWWQQRGPLVQGRTQQTKSIGWKKSWPTNKEKVQRLSAQLSTNVRLSKTHEKRPFFKLFVFQSHVVSAFEHSLSNMTNRLSKLNRDTEKKVVVFSKKTFYGFNKLFLG